MQERVAIISGYFNPIHRGHIEYAKLAKEFVGENGYVYCIVNSDHQALLKKGHTFVPEKDRLATMDALKYVDRAILSIDSDRTVCATIEHVAKTANPKPTHFLKGGDVTSETKCPEVVVCEAHGIQVEYGFGDKVQSSSWILDALK